MGNSKRYAATVTFQFCTKKGEVALPEKTRSRNMAHKKSHGNIALMMLERMRLTCWVLQYSLHPRPTLSNRYDPGMAEKDPYDSYDPYRSRNNGLRVVQLVTCMSLERLKVCIQVHDPYDSYDSYWSWNNGLRVVQLVNCIHNYIRMISETNMLRTMYVPRSENVNAPKRKMRWIFFVLKAWEPISAIDSVYSSES